MADWGMGGGEWVMGGGEWVMGDGGWVTGNGLRVTGDGGRGMNGLRVMGNDGLLRDRPCQSVCSSVSVRVVPFNRRNKRLRRGHEGNRQWEAARTAVGDPWERDFAGSGRVTMNAVDHCIPSPLKETR